MNKSESKYFNTAVKMDEAFLKILYNKEFEYITVQEICREAGVNRSTFYLHYETVGDLLEETMGYIYSRFDRHFPNMSMDAEKINSLPVEDLYFITPEYLVPWLNFIKENQRLFETFITRHETLGIVKSYENIFSNVISPILTKNKIPTEDQEYIFLFYVEGIIAIVKKWIREGCVRPISDIVTLIGACVRKHEKN